MLQQIWVHEIQNTWDLRWDYAQYLKDKRGEKEMNAFTLAEEIINGRRITREDDLSFS
mgnify:CR=1 FL=1